MHSPTMCSSASEVPILARVLPVISTKLFIDDEELQRGDEITPSLLKAIEESRIAIIVLSTNYASSSFCLDELSKIIHCIKAEGRLVLPVFYKVDPSDVRHQRGAYGEALALHKERFKINTERLQKWTTALRQIADLSGFHFKQGDGYEHEFIGRIVELVSNKINRAPLHVAEYPLGLESPVLKVKGLLDVGSESSHGSVLMVGIYGIGGVGKTTLALAVYNLIADKFDGLCFLQNVRENCNKKGLQHLQEVLLSKMMGGRKVKITGVNEGISTLKHRLPRKKVLLILDDVDKIDQLEAMAGGSNWFGPGSRVIITTRDKHLLARHGVERKYEVKELNEKEAFELLRWKAFKNKKVDPGYEDILSCAVTYASDLPLALEVIGSNLFGKSIEEWKSALHQYQRIPNKEIQQILKVSFDALEEEEKSVFLDIACCFKGYPLAEVQNILHAHYDDCMKHHIGVLVEKSLIKIDWHGGVTLHDLIEDMGKEIVRQESPKKPGKRSRLWFQKDIVHVLKEDKGTKKIEIICLSGKEEVIVEWNGKAFEKIKNLKTLIISQGYFSRGPDHLPNSLRVLEWRRYPSQCLPPDFQPEQLAICKIMNSFFTSPELAGLVKKFVNISVLNFDDCEYLTQIPDVSGLPKLEEFSFKYCKNLTTIDDSVGLLDKLKFLDCTWCAKLRAFPPIKLTSLKVLNFTGCSSLESFPEILEEMKNIKSLYLFRSPIKEFPSSFENLTGLQKLYVQNCRFVQLPSCIVKLRILVVNRGHKLKLGSLPKVGNIEYLQLMSCNVSDEFLAVGLTWFANVKNLNLQWNDFTIIPECIKECRLLRKLNLDYCKRLREIRGIPPNLKYFSATHCPSLTSESISKLLDQKLHQAGNTRFCMHGTIGIPEWFEHRSSRGRPISFWFRNKFPTIAVCLVVDGWEDSPTVIINGNKKKYGWPYKMKQDHTYLFGMQPDYIKLDAVPLKNEWNRVKVRCGPIQENDKGQIGIHVFEEKISMEDIRFTNPDPSSHGNSDSDSERGREFGEFDIGEPSFLHQQQEGESNSDHEQSLVDVDEASILSDSEDDKKEDLEEQKKKKRRKLGNNRH